MTKGAGTGGTGSRTDVGPRRNSTGRGITLSLTYSSSLDVSVSVTDE